MSMTPKELRQLARNDLLAFTSLVLPKTPAELLLRPCQPVTGAPPAEPEPMTPEELAEGFAATACGPEAPLADWQEAQWKQAALVLKFIQSQGVPRETHEPLYALVEALQDLKDGVGSSLLKARPFYKARDKVRSEREDRVLLCQALLVQAFTEAAAPGEQRPVDEALKKTKAELLRAGAKDVSYDTLKNRRIEALKREAFADRRARLIADEMWPRYPGDMARAEALAALWAPMFAKEARGF